jgi:PAS domain S-box-containing protein
LQIQREKSLTVIFTYVANGERLTWFSDARGLGEITGGSAYLSLIALLVVAVGCTILLIQRLRALRNRIQSLSDSDEMFRLLLDGIKDYAVLRLDSAGRVASWNTGAARIKGYDAEEILGKHFSCFYTPHDRERKIPEKILREAMTRGRSEAEGLRLRKDGSSYWARVVIAPMYDQGGNLRGYSKVLHDISAQKASEEAVNESLLASRWMLKELTEQKFAMDQHAIVSTTDIYGNITYVNDHFCAISGYTREELIGQNHRMVRSGYHSPEFFQDMWKTIQSGRVWRGEIQNRTKEGSHYWVDATIVPFLDEQGKPRQYTAIRSDITIQKRVQDELQEHTQILNLAQVLVRDMEDRIVRWSRGAEKLYGFSSKEAIGKLSHELLRSELPEPLEQIRKKLYENRSWEGEVVHHRRDGSLITVNSAWVLHYDGQGRAVHILEVNNDITERKRAEQTLAHQAEELSRQSEELARTDEALRRQTQLLQSVLDGMGEGLVVADLNGKFLVWNPAAERILGIGAKNVPIESWSKTYGLHKEDGSALHPTEDLPLVRALRGESCETEIQIVKPGAVEPCWIEVTARPLRNENETVIAGVAAFRDITERKMAEQNVRRLNDELERRVAQRTAELEATNRELEAFTYSVSHDLRAPLRHIAGFSGILLEEFGASLPAEAQRYVGRIQNGSRRMGQLLDELLNLTRLGRQDLKTQIVGLGSLVKEVIAELEGDCEGREVEWKIGDLPFVECDAMLVRQVFQNLISNALKYSRPRTKAVIEIGEMQEGQERTVFVRDNGVGFSMKYADKLFGVFQRLHRDEDFEGTGVGLATVQRIIQKHKGRVWATAELDQGATFYFTLEALNRPSHQKRDLAVGA